MIGFGSAAVLLTLLHVSSAAAATVTLSATSGPPGTLITVSASGFGDAEAVDVYVDTVDTLLLVTSATGTFIDDTTHNRG
jgi:hypothetical protein